MEEVEYQGGVHLDATCDNQEYEWVGEGEVTQAAAAGAGGGISLDNCGNASLFIVPYAREPKAGNTAEMGEVRVCAVDDDLGRWPRFQHVIEES